jgi:hypothetical protein
LADGRLSPDREDVLLEHPNARNAMEEAPGAGVGR